MSIQTAGEKNSLAAKYGTDAAFGAIYTSAPGAAAGTEPSGGTPAYARKALTWGAPSNGVVTATATFDVPSGATIVGAGLHTTATGGSYLDGTALTSQAFSGQGTLAVSFSYTQS